MSAGYADVIDVMWLAPATFVLRTTRPPGPVRAGQCFSVGLDSLAINREYSLFSGADDPYLDFLIRRVDGGRVSEALSNMRPGQEVTLTGPFGAFCLPEEASQRCGPYVFIASGTGVAPFASFVRSHPDLEYRVFHGIRRPEEAYGTSSFAPERYEVSISGEPGRTTHRRVTAALAEADLDPAATFYLCGNRAMITDAVGVLRSKAVPGGSILMETFF